MQLWDVSGRSELKSWIQTRGTNRPFCSLFLLTSRLQLCIRLDVWMELHVINEHTTLCLKLQKRTLGLLTTNLTIVCFIEVIEWHTDRICSVPRYFILYNVCSESLTVAINAQRCFYKPLRLLKCSLFNFSFRLLVTLCDEHGDTSVIPIGNNVCFTAVKSFRWTSAKVHCTCHYIRVAEPLTRIVNRIKPVNRRVSYRGLCQYYWPDLLLEHVLNGRAYYLTVPRSNTLK